MVRVLAGEDIRRVLSMTKAIAAVREAFVCLSDGNAQLPLRVPVQVPAEHGVTLFMPACMPTEELLGVKIVSVFGRNEERGLPLVQAMVTLVDARTGAPRAVLEGAALTALRTGAASGVATDCLARLDARTVAVFGAGKQGRAQLEAVCAVRQIEMAWVYDVRQKTAAAFRQDMERLVSVPIQVAETPAQAIGSADIVCTATTSTSPVFANKDVRAGMHINAIGAYTPDMQEIPAETVIRAKTVVDHRESSLSEAGDILIPINRGLLDQSHIYAEIGEIAGGKKRGRESATEITLFKSVGVAVQDLAVAGAAVAAAERAGVGLEVAL